MNNNYRNQSPQYKIALGPQAGVERYSYAHYTGQPYIHQHGVPINKPREYTEQPMNRNRTIIRTIAPAPNCCIYAGIPTNGAGKI